MAILLGNRRELDLQELRWPSQAGFYFNNDHRDNLPRCHGQKRRAPQGQCHLNHWSCFCADDKLHKEDRQYKEEH
eukprot:4023829-Amphidinium_carterae.1